MSLEPHHRSGYTAEASRSIVCTDLVECKPLFQACVPLQYKPILEVAYRLRAQAQRSDCRIVFSRKTLASTMYSPLPSMTTPTTTRTGRLRHTGSPTRPRSEMHSLRATACYVPGVMVETRGALALSAAASKSLVRPPCLPTVYMPVSTKALGATTIMLLSRQSRSNPDC